MRIRYGVKCRGCMSELGDSVFEDKRIFTMSSNRFGISIMECPLCLATYYANVTIDLVPRTPSASSESHKRELVAEHIQGVRAKKGIDTNENHG